MAISKFKKLIRFISSILFIFFILLFLYTNSFLIHDCHDEHCEICEIVNINKNNFKIIIKNTSSIFVFCFICFVLNKKLFDCYIVKETLVAKKVRLNN